jgi:hypothetical protein
VRKWLIIVPVLLIVLIIAFLPQIASTSLGKPLFVKALEQKSQAQVEIGSLRLSWFGPQQFHNLQWTHEAASGTIEELEIEAPFWTFSGPFKLKNGSIAYKGGRVEKIEGKIVGNDFNLTGITMKGYIALQGQIYSKLHFHLKIDVKEFPLIVIDQQLDQLLGPTLDLNGTISLEHGKGSIDLTINADNLNTRVQGILTENSITLDKPLLAAIRLTPKVSALLLKDANPLFLTGMSAENQINLRIEKEDFYFPLPYSLEKLRVGAATLDVGRVKCQNGESLQTIISILKAERLSDATQMNAWFAPVTFSIVNGILQAGRMDALLADSIHICTWGNIDIVRDQIDMFLGLPADTLQQSFGIKNLPPSYVLKIKIRGTTKKPEIVKGPAVAKIAALIAAGQIPKKGILGGLADLISTPKEEKDVPPAKRPFPWEK